MCIIIKIVLYLHDNTINAEKEKYFNNNMFNI
jgi:hypothetical protein